jgi:hypothetical protein
MIACPYAWNTEGSCEMETEDSELEAYRAQRVAHLQYLKELHESPEFHAQLRYIRRFSNDASVLLRLCYSYSARAKEFSKNSLVVQSTDDLAQSIMAGWLLVEGGLINPVRRELRYVIESCIKYLYADQQCAGKPLAERVQFLKTVDSSIDVRYELKLGAMHDDDAKHFVDELYDAYRDCCAYVHVSPSQVDERLKQAERGGALGYETPDELRKLGRLMFRVYDMALTLYFHGYDLSMTGDVFVGVLDDQEKWSFHKGKYVPVVSAYYDYKHERNMRKYGESRPWDPKGWPPKQL